jgi:uncharacterized cofD-like protein
LPGITVIGGGTGLSVLLRGIKNISDKELTAIVSVADDGGSSGILREDLGMLPPGDIRSCLLALASEEEGMREILAYRFSGGRLDGQNVGNLLIAAASEIYGGFQKGLERVSDILKVRGKVVPVCPEKMVLCAELDNGNIVVGESQIPRVALREGSAIRDVFLESGACRISDGARKAIREADIVIIGPGSLYTSIIPNFLTDGLAQELSRSEAMKFFIGNVMTQPGETDGMSVADHVRVLTRYAEGVRIQCVLANNVRLPEDVLRKYTEDGAAQLLPTDEDRDYLAAAGIELVEGAFIESFKGYIRHDAARVAEAISCRFRQK